MIRFAYTIVYVQDVSRSLQFYQNAFGLQTCFLHPSQTYGELDTGTTKLAFAAHGLAEGNLPDGYLPVDHQATKPLGIEIALMTDDVPASVSQAVAAGARVVVEPSEKPWGQTVAYLRDPDGTLLEICSPVQTNTGSTKDPSS